MARGEGADRTRAGAPAGGGNPGDLGPGGAGGRARGGEPRRHVSQPGREVGSLVPLAGRPPRRLELGQGLAALDQAQVAGRAADHLEAVEEVELVEPEPGGPGPRAVQILVVVEGAGEAGGDVLVRDLRPPLDQGHVGRRDARPLGELDAGEAELGPPRSHARVEAWESLTCHRVLRKSRLLCRRLYSNLSLDSLFTLQYII